MRCKPKKNRKLNEKLELAAYLALLRRADLGCFAFCPPAGHWYAYSGRHSLVVSNQEEIILAGYDGGFSLYLGRCCSPGEFSTEDVLCGGESVVGDRWINTQACLSLAGAHLQGDWQRATALPPRSRVSLLHSVNCFVVCDSYPLFIAHAILILAFADDDASIFFSYCCRFHLFFGSREGQRLCFAFDVGVAAEIFVAGVYSAGEILRGLLRHLPAPLRKRVAVVPRRPLFS